TMSNAHDGCGPVRKALGIYYFGELTEVLLAAVEQHLAVCKRCLEEYYDWGQFLEHLCTLLDLDAGSLPSQLDNADSVGVAVVRVGLGWPCIRPGRPGSRATQHSSRSTSTWQPSASSSTRAKPSTWRYPNVIRYEVRRGMNLSEPFYCRAVSVHDG